MKVPFIVGVFRDDAIIRERLLAETSALIFDAAVSMAKAFERAKKERHFTHESAEVHA